MAYAASSAAVGGHYRVSVTHIAFHRFDFYIFTARCKGNIAPCMRALWVPILKMLKVAKKRLINWSPSIAFPTEGVFPTSRRVLRSMAAMFFNPDPARRLRLMPIEGMSQDQFHSCHCTDMNHSRSHYERHANYCQRCRSGHALPCLHSNPDGNFS